VYYARRDSLFRAYCVINASYEWRLYHGAVHAEILMYVVGIWKRNPRIVEYERKIREAPRLS